jgi:hypothetical protein
MLKGFFTTKFLLDEQMKHFLADAFNVADFLLLRSIICSCECTLNRRPDGCICPGQKLDTLIETNNNVRSDICTGISHRA